MSEETDARYRSRRWRLAVGTELLATGYAVWITLSAFYLFLKADLTETAYLDQIKYAFVGWQTVSTWILGLYGVMNVGGKLVESRKDDGS